MCAFDELLQDLNMLAILDGNVERQVAWYPVGASGYSIHTDAKPDDGTLRSERRITAIVYCNDCWHTDHAGELRLWPAGQRGKPVDIGPTAGRLVLFLSGCIPHQVMQTHCDRVAVTM